MEISGWKYFKIIAHDIQKPVFSEFYEEHYVPPQNVKIAFLDKKKNLLYIIMESMESSFADLESGGVFEKNHIPNLTALASENINFSHTDKIGGGIDATGTGWTVAALLAKFSGLPFALPAKGNAEHLKHFLPGSVMLTDILRDAGYNARFVFGSDKAFASRDALLETHGCEVHDINWYKEQKLLDKNYSVFWGFEDAKLYDFAKLELADLAAKNEPFMLGLLTVDTHFPEGYICQFCSTEHEGTDRQIFSAVECADRQIAEFLAWAKTQSWYEETTIVIAGDHLFMQTGDRDIFNVLQNYKTDKNREKHDFSAVGDTPRRWLNIFINSEIEAASAAAQINRNFSSFDMLPTVLESLGAEIEGHALGFGRSLFTGDPTIFEQFDESYVNEEISKRSVQYFDML